VLRAERDEAYAPANYVSTELNLKDHRRGRGDAGPDDLRRASRLGLRDDGVSPEIRGTTTVAAGETAAPVRTDRWKSPRDDISAELILSCDVGQSRRE